ncbi:MAG: Gfo/Idh/MocA family oxidoreductase [Planctomycetes bacterium]|nr:Gfo/Idh/MocA family oxidoreductase [Planctomycetota bacterium]
MTETRSSAPTRRDFVRNSSAAIAGFAAMPALGGAGVHHGVNDELRIGLIGCGGRGSGAANDALAADPSTRLVAMGDVFPDRLAEAHRALSRSEFASRITVDEDHRFTGFDAYKKVIESCDVVLLAATPHFRPLHLRAAIEAGKHVFCEKPIATDPTGVRSVMETCEMARAKKLNLVSGLCYRYDEPKQELMARLHDGAVGEPVALECTYNTGALWFRGDDPDWSPMERQLRNWLYYTWLSGDHIAEQSIHSLDKILWAMKDEPPAKVTASGGRIRRIEPQFGDVYDHFNTVFEWANGVKLFHSCRQIEGADRDVSDFVYGTKGVAAIQSHYITGPNEWRWRGRADSMYRREHQSLFAAIRAGRVIDNGDYMCKATLMAIMGRMSAYTGKTLTWEQALNSQLDLRPAAYAWGDAPPVEIARPGLTPFV